MPPPTVVDPWLAARRFGVVIDAGSSGSRLQIYSWRDTRALAHSQPLDVLPKVEKGTQDSEQWSIKVEPGISSFATNPEAIAPYLAPLLEHARTVIPPSLQPETPLFLLATAGMRLLPPEQQAEVLQATCHFLKFHSHFRIDEASPVGPCGSSVRIITGEEEGLFGWIAVNYLMDGFSGSNNGHLTYGFLDMGGASTQIAFEPSEEERAKSQNLIDVRLRLLNGNEVKHQVFVTTWLGYGTNQARERYVGKTINDYEAVRNMAAVPPSSTAELVMDPCLPKNLSLKETPVQANTSSAHSLAPHTLYGTGSFEQCLQRTSALLNKDAPCPDTHCLFNGVYVPPIDFSASHFIGISEYWYSSEHVFGLGGAYDVVQYERAASEFCAREWADIVHEHEATREQGTLGGDGEVAQDGKIVSTGKWGENVEVPRLQMQCFKAAWIVNVLHEGIGLPRIVDPGGNSTTHGNKVEQQAESKGLGRPTFQSMDSVGDIAISWTLGKMVLEASKEVPPLSKSSPPLGDPLDDASRPVDSPIQPIRPIFNFDFDAIEDRISPHLPPSLTRESLGFSLVAFLLYCFMVTVFLAVTYRLRHRVRSAMRRFGRKRDRAQSYSLEEGQLLYHPRSPSPWTPSPARSSFQLLQPLASLSSSLSGLGSRPSRPPPISVSGPGTPPRSNPTTPTRRSPMRSFSFPVSKGSPGLGADANGAATAYAPGSPRLHDGSIAANGSVSSLSSRSRNSSQMNLSALTPRQALSRSSSGVHMAGANMFREDET
ncbi:nucleoside phosphatase family-domain-containing protein [Amylocystis lapponica]|nr:nucleoside phosphatase family-domain-containing protein [Amylocystis lapponica]